MTKFRVLPYRMQPFERPLTAVRVASLALWICALSARAATYDVPMSIAHDYSVDVTAELQAFIDAVPDNSVIAFPALAYDETAVGYRIEGTLTLVNRHGLHIEGHGAHLRAFDPLDPLVYSSNEVRTRSQWRVGSGNTDIAFRELHVYGAHPNAGKDGVYDAAREAQNAFDITGVDGLLIDGCHAHNTFGDGVYIGGQSYRVTIRNCHVSHVGRQCMSPCGGSDILIQNNLIEDSRRGIIDIEPYGASWSVDNVRIIGNTLGDSRLLCFPMGGGGNYGTVYIANNTAMGVNGVPKIAYWRDDAPSRRGPMIVVNNTFAVLGSGAPGFRFKPVDGLFFAGNWSSFTLNRYPPGMLVEDCHGAIVANNVFKDATTNVVADILTSPLWMSDSPLSDTGWSRQVVVEEFAANPGCYHATVPYSDGVVVNGRILAIWRAVEGTAPLTHGLLTTHGDYAAVKLDSAGTFVEGFSLKGNGSYGGVDLPWLQPAEPSNLTVTRVSTTEVRLDWLDNMANESGFKVEQAPDVNGVPGTWTHVGTVGASVTTYAATGLQAGARYYFRVRTYNAVANSIYSNIATFFTGWVSREVWSNVAGTAVADIPLGAAPGLQDALTSLEGPTDWADNYGARIRGYIVAPTTGAYTFWLAGNGNCELWLSTNDQPAAKAKAASIDGAGYTAPREWSKYASQKSVPITMAAGSMYYVEVLHKAGTGGDNVAVGWAKPGEATGSPSQVIPGSRLSPFEGGKPNWEFNTAGNAEGWGSQNEIAGIGVSGGSLNGTVTGNDPYVRSATLSQSASVTHVKVRLKNSTASTTAQLYFTTAVNPAWTGTSVATLPNSDFTEYTFDMTTVPGWLGCGTITRLRLDPANDALGSFKVDYIRMCTAGSPNQAPSVRLTAPDNGATYTAPASVTLTATASDSDGMVAKVEFFHGGTKLGEDTTAPYSCAWAGVTAGTYSLTVRATDDDGAVAASSPVAISVNAGVSGLAWEFNTDGNLEGWQAKNQITGLAVSSGVLSGVITGNDPYLWSPAISQSATAKLIRVRLKNSTASTDAKLYFVTSADGAWNEAKSRQVPIQANSDFMEYTFDMTPVAGWAGTITRLRLDPATDATGSFGIDCVRMGEGNGGPDGYTWCANEGDTFLLPGTCDVAYGANGSFSYLFSQTGSITFNNATFGDPIYGVVKSGYYKLVGVTGSAWEFNTAGDTEGWSAQNHITALGTSGGALNGTITGNDPQVRSPTISQDAAADQVTVRLRNSTASTSAQLFFITSADSSWNEAKSRSLAVQPNSDFVVYTFDMSTVSGWAGTITRLRLDPAADAAGSFQVDYIRVEGGQMMGFSQQPEAFSLTRQALDGGERSEAAKREGRQPPHGRRAHADPAAPIPVTPADYDGDGIEDRATYCEASGIWRIHLSGDAGVPVVVRLGGRGAVPVVADYDGDAKADPAVYYEETGLWEMLFSSADDTDVIVPPHLLGGLGYRGVPADYDGDGFADPAVYGEIRGDWAIMLSGADCRILDLAGCLGGRGYVACPADYDGDGRTDPAVRKATGSEGRVMFSSLDYEEVPVTLDHE